MKKITNIHCKIYLINTFAGTATGEWKYMGKTIDENGDILRKFSHEEEGIVEIIQNGNYLSIYDRIITKQKTWQEYLTKHFSHPVYDGEKYSLKEMLDMYLAGAEHGRQHQSGYARFIVYNNEDCLEVELGNKMPMFIKLSELKDFGYVPKVKQSADDFLHEHWNWY